MKTKNILLPLILVTSVLCSSCSSYLPLQTGVWQNDELITFEEHGITIDSVRVEIIENDNPDFVYDDLNAITDDGGEYLTNTGLILYVYLDNVPIIDISLFTYMSDSWRHGTYVYNDIHLIEIRLRLNNDRKNKTTFFEAIFNISDYADGDPSSTIAGSSERSNPSTVYLYEV